MPSVILTGPMSDPERDAYQRFVDGVDAELIEKGHITKGEIRSLRAKLDNDLRKIADV